MKKFAVGIDLGTTNCTMAYCELEADNGDVRLFEIPQVTRLGMTEGKSSLPSFIYVPRDGEFSASDIALPWDASPEYVVGAFARDHGAKVPRQLISSSKSWLCHGGVRREDPILPQGGEQRISPVKAAELLLRHLRNAWDTVYGPQGAYLREQAVVVTVPASFDPIARELTVRAIAQAGFGEVTLLEEPQAALYAWLERAGDEWRSRVNVDDDILVCDVGGGTSDFSQIRVTERDGQLELERVAVGNHILLGGDNMDIALAHVAGLRLKESGATLDPWQARELWYRCRDAKEALLSDPALTSCTVSVLGRGSSLVGGTISTEVTRADIAAVILKGFLPSCAREEGPQGRRASGLRQQGLPYAQDPAITRHLAGFVSQNNDPEKPHPDHLLFNGGVFKAPALRNRVQHVMGAWGTADTLPTLLEASDVGHAVALGAAYFSKVRQGAGVRIKGGTAATYYIGVESAAPAIPGFEPPLEALCVAPFGMEEGTGASLEGEELSLVVGEPAVFRFFRSLVRKGDTIGMLVDGNGVELEELDPLEMTLRGEGLEDGSFVPVQLETRVTEVGTIEVWCHSTESEQQWRLQFDLRAGEGS